MSLITTWALITGLRTTARTLFVPLALVAMEISSELGRSRGLSTEYWRWAEALTANAPWKMAIRQREVVRDVSDPRSIANSILKRMRNEMAGLNAILSYALRAAKADIVERSLRVIKKSIGRRLFFRRSIERSSANYFISVIPAGGTF